MFTFSRLMWLVATVSLVAGCSSTPAPKVVPPAVVIEVPAPPANFTIAAGELDTWNAIGQLLVRMDGVTYEGRAQKLGLYAVEYRGEKFLLLTRGTLVEQRDQSHHHRSSSCTTGRQAQQQRPGDRVARFAASALAGGIDSHRIGKETCTGEERPCRRRAAKPSVRR